MAEPVSRQIKRRGMLSGVVGAGGVAAPGVVRAEAERVLRFIPQADLATLDPMFSSVHVTRNHGYAIFDTFHGQNSAFRIHRQMVKGEVDRGEMGRVWRLRLRLRDGLWFHDETPVLAPCCVAGIRRWARRADALGHEMATALDNSWHWTTLCSCSGSARLSGGCRCRWRGRGRTGRTPGPWRRRGSSWRPGTPRPR